MKKILSSILISLVIFVNLFAPISVVLENGGIKVRGNKASAAWILDGKGDDPIKLTITSIPSDTSIKITVNAYWPEKSQLSKEYISVNKLSKDQTDPTKTLYDKEEKLSLQRVDGNNSVGSVIFEGLNPLTTYKFDVYGSQDSTNLFQSTINLLNNTVYYLTLTAWDPGTMHNTGQVKTESPIEVTTIAKGATITDSSAETTVAANDVATLPNCEWYSSSTWGGCVGVLLYWAVFKPTSFIFGLTGKLLDLSVDYSTKDTSYRSAFITEGWGLIRDFCNMFFIFVMLYIAIGKILHLHSVKTKEMIINVVIIGLFINFSLFATQVIIDASNMFTRVFYNSQSIAVGPKDDKGVVQSQPGTQGEIKLSEAIVGKINPQKLLLQASRIDNIPNKQSTIAETKVNDNGITSSTFILVTILASIVNIVGLIVFLSCALIFISRVIGLWLAMIFAPFAFFSYTVPALQDTDMVGWKKWWPETLNLAFLAPVFVFFLYLIIKFLDTKLGLVINDSQNGMDFILGVFIPFIFIMVLLTKAKDIAKKMSGTMGQSITNGLAAAGGAVLGTAALGTAFLGRKVIGQTMAAASRGDTASQQYMDPTKRAEMGILRKSLGFVGSGFGSGNGINKIHDYTGKQLNKKQETIEKVDHARHVVDSVKDKRYKDVDWSRLSDTQRQNVKGDFVKENKSKWAQEEEDSYRRGKGYDDKKALTPTEITELRDQVTARANKEFEHEIELATTKVKGFDRAISQINTGSMDIRKLSEIKSDKREGFFTKMPVMLTAAVAMGMRSGIKGSGLSGGSIKVEGNFMKDLSNTINDSLKATKLNVDISHVGETKSSADPHAGAHH